MCAWSAPSRSCGSLVGSPDEDALRGPEILSGARLRRRANPDTTSRRIRPARRYSALVGHDSFKIGTLPAGIAAASEMILRSVPEWFGIESALLGYVKASEEWPTWFAIAGEAPIGFITIHTHFRESAEIHCIAARPEWHRRGVGRALVRHAEGVLRVQGVRFLQVKTLSPRRACEHYDRTREFYLAMGYVPLEEFPLLWDERNPALQLVKAL